LLEARAQIKEFKIQQAYSKEELEESARAIEYLEKKMEKQTKNYDRKLAQQLEVK
jgi:biopolymer transport protein ExbB/TolQ